MDLSPILNPLNDEQRAAVTAPPRATLVLAGAGSGKTRVLTHRVACVIAAEGAAPHNVLAVTFTNKAAAEMRGRIESLLHVPGDAHVGRHFPRHRAPAAAAASPRRGLPRGFQIMDSEDQQRLIKRLLKAQGSTKRASRRATWQYFINKHKDEGIGRRR